MSELDYVDASYHSDDSSASDGEHKGYCNEYLIPSYVNAPDPDSINALQWGRNHYIRFYPSLKRLPYT